jgi:hypothetical protein
MGGLPLGLVAMCPSGRRELAAVAGSEIFAASKPAGDAVHRISVGWIRDESRQRNSAAG